MHLQGVVVETQTLLRPAINLSAPNVMFEGTSRSQAWLDIQPVHCGS